MVDELPVEIGDVLHTCEILEFLDGTHTDDFFKVITDPQRDRVAPVAVAGKAPVLGIFEPVVEALFLGKSRNPVGLHVVLEKVLFDLSHANEPGIVSLIDQRSVRTPAKRV